MSAKFTDKIKAVLHADIDSALFRGCLKIVMIYLTIGALWIYFSDRLTRLLAPSGSMWLLISTLKGCLYVLITGVLLYQLIIRLLKKIDLAERALKRNYKELLAVNWQLESALQQQINSDAELRTQYRRVSESEKRLEYLSYHDQLTGLYNRRFFKEELPRLDKKENLPLSVIMTDVNGLKLVNDSFGHLMGDEILKKVVEIVEQAVRDGDLAARLSGDEFIILLPRTADSEAAQMAELLNRLAVGQRVGSVDLSFSVGCATKYSCGENILEVVKRAEDRMYKNKLFAGPSQRSKTVDVIITTLHEKNKREEQHSLRVSELCEGMGRALGLTETEVSELKAVGLLHDIGKIAIDEKILNKDGRLTDEEWEEIRRHPEVGFRILCAVSHMGEMAEFVLAHHERWDGSGYPRGLAGKEIPLQSRIIAVADAYDAMVSERPYRKSLTREEAVNELVRCAGMQFDPVLIDVFVSKVLCQYGG